MVNPNTGVAFSQTEAEAEEAAWGILAGKSMRSLKFADENPPGSRIFVDRPIGTKYTGTVVKPPKRVQATDFDSKQPKFYADGQPIWELLLELHVPSDVDPSDPDDDGLRQLRLGQYGKRALQDEMARLGVGPFGPGTQLTIEFTGYKPSNKGRASKLYGITLENVQPYVPVGARQMTEALAQPQQAIPTPQAAQGVAPVAQQPVYQQPVAQQAPQPVYQQPVAQQAPQPVAPVQTAPAAGMVVTADHLANVNLLLGAGIAREAAIQSVVANAGGDAAFAAALDNEVPF